MILMWSCSGNMPKCLSDLGNILAYYLDKTTLLYKYWTLITIDINIKHLCNILSHFTSAVQYMGLFIWFCICNNKS